MLLMHTGAVLSKATRSTQGVVVMTLRKGSRVLKAERYSDDMLSNPNRYRKNIPATGSLPNAQETVGEQLKL